VSPVRYELEFYIPEGAILHSDCRGNLKSYIDYSCLQKALYIRTPYRGTLLHAKTVSAQIHSLSWSVHAIKCPTKVDDN
jgi:hypothetical protein